MLCIDTARHMASRRGNCYSPTQLADCLPHNDTMCINDYVLDMLAFLMNQANIR